MEEGKEKKKGKAWVLIERSFENRSELAGFRHSFVPTGQCQLHRCVCTMCQWIRPYMTCACISSYHNDGTQETTPFTSHLLASPCHANSSRGFCGYSLISKRSFAVSGLLCLPLFVSLSVGYCTTEGFDGVAGRGGCACVCRSCSAGWLVCDQTEPSLQRAGTELAPIPFHVQR